jgi:hypothetical protein
MTTTTSNQYHRAIKREMAKYHAQVKKDPEEARRFLQKAGILGKDGELAPRYRTRKKTTPK